MKHQRLLRMAALLLALCLLLTGCNFHIDPPEVPTNPPRATQAPTEPDPTEETVPPRTLPEIFDPADYPDAVDYSEMEYQRPDVDAICAEIDDLTATITGGASLHEILTALDEVEDGCNEFYTMDTLAYIEYGKDLGNTYYKEEYDYLENQAPLLQQSMERMYEAAANCAYKDELENAYFGEDFLDFYLTHHIYTNDAFVALAQKESALQTQYMMLQDSTEIEIDGQSYDFDQLCEEYADDEYTLYMEIFPAYYEKYNQPVGEIFVELVKTRQQMTQAIGYDSYADYAYSFVYGRDYTPEMARAYTAQIRDTLVPLFFEILAQDGAGNLTYGPMSMEDVTTAVAESLYLMDEQYYEWFEYMQYFHLWDATASSSKMPGSYQTYLYSYAEPFIFITPTGTRQDYLTLTHEFGHFIDAMANDGMNESIDKCEIFSQGLESLVLFYNEMPSAAVRLLTRQKMMDALQVLIYQAAYADFEDRVYLQADELSVEKVNEIYAQVMQEYGLGADGIDWYRQTWIDVMHFFIAPDYVISYCASADAALQIYQLEAETSGAGLAAYQTLMEHAVELDFVALLEDAGMKSPFEEGRVAELDELFRQQLLSGGK